MRRRTLSILALSFVLIAAVVAVALAAVPPNLSHAIEAQKRLTVDHPQDPAAFNDLGNLFTLAHQSAEAEAAYRKAVELDPQRVSALFNLGLLLQQRGETKDALDYFHQVLEIQPEHAWAHYQAGALYETRGQESKAVDEYARALALDPQLAFPEVNPHVVENKLLTQAMLRAYQKDYGVPQAPSIYEDPHRIANLLVPPPQVPGAETSTKDAVAAKPAAQQPGIQPGQQPAGPGTAGRAPAAQPDGAVIRERDLDTRMTGQAGPRGALHTAPAAPGANMPRGARQWERPEPTVQYPSEDDQQQQQQYQQPILAPGQVVTPPPAGGVYYRPGYQSTGRLNLQLVPEKRDARG